jgi:hypothetical protein
MSKIICDVCGTRYPDSSEQCPICGCVNGNAANEPEQTIETEEFELPARAAVKGGRFSKANVRKRMKNQPVYEEPAEVRTRAIEQREQEEAYDEENFAEDNGGKGGTILNVLLVIVIIALLAVSAKIFLEYFMPNFIGDKDPFAPTESYVQTETPTDAPAEVPTETQEPTEAPTVPCQQLVLDVTDVTLREAGEMYLLNVQILPEDTTDAVQYVSSNENVATVNEEGRVTAVGEGSVVISVICGEQHLECNVVCDFSPEETEGPTETPTEAGVQKTVTSKTLNIRSGAGTSYEKVGTYKKGDVVTIYEEKKVGTQMWGRTDEGWICTDYVK